MTLTGLADAFAGIQTLLARLVEELAWLDERGEGASPSDSFVATNYGGSTVMVQKSLTPEREQAWRATENTPLWSMYWREPSALPTEERAWHVSLDKGTDGPLHLWVRRAFYTRHLRRYQTSVKDWMIEVSASDERDMQMAWLARAALKLVLRPGASASEAAVLRALEEHGLLGDEAERALDALVARGDVTRRDGVVVMREQ